MQIINIKNRIKNLIPEEKRSIVIIISLSVLFVVFIIFAYIPKQTKVARLKRNLTSLEQQIDLTQTMLGDIEKLSYILAGMQKDLASFEGRLLSTKNISSVISELSSTARLCTVDVVSIKPHESTPLLDDDLNPVSLEASPISEIKIELKLLASYRSLADYVRKIQESLKLLATIEDVTISRKQDMAPKLDIKLTISIYTGENR
ncbi:MAG: type 4a pilus biogenesis protein PilO [Candidatus Omnitrophota bacterium]